MLFKKFYWLFALSLSNSSLFGATLEKPFPFFEGQVRVPVGNHGSASVEILDQRLLKSTDGYGPHTEEITLDWSSGSIELTRVDYTPNKTIKTSHFLPAEQGGAYLPYRKQLQAMVGDLTWIHQNLNYLNEATQELRKPEMAAVLEYLKELLAQSDARAPESVALNPLPRDLRRGIRHSISVEFLAHDDRDLLLEVFDAEWRYLEGTRVRLSAAHKTVDVALTIPANAPLDQPGFIVAKLVPVDGVWSEMLAEVKQPASFKKTRMITGSNASYIGFDSPRVAFYTNFYCAEGCAVRVDIFDAQGQWLMSQSVPANPPYASNSEQFTSLYVDAATSLFAADQVYTYYVKILPQAGNWDQYYDEVRGTFKIGN